MLIRLMAHHIDNPRHIDKLICIKGLPEEWMFRTTVHGKELIKPWLPDIEENIPLIIRHLCDPVEIAIVYPPVEKGSQFIVDKKTILGVRMDYATEEGEVMWEKIERLLDRVFPRDQLIPKPVIVAPDQKSIFDPHLARRNSRGQIELKKSEIPFIDITGFREVPVNDPRPVAILNPQHTETVAESKTFVVPPPDTEPTPEFICTEAGCAKKFTTLRAMKMHVLGAHRSHAKIEAPVEV